MSINSQDTQSLANLRHSTAHLLAAAVLELFPQAKPTIGPSIDDGFYYDFDFGNQPITEKDLSVIEQKMRQLVKNWTEFSRIEVTPKEARSQFANNPYKTELIDEFAKEGKTLTLYQSGNFIDLCRGGHIDQPQNKIKHFKLLHLAGAYWRGSETNPMLTRIYGTAFYSANDLKEYLTLRQEAKKRDHKQLGPKLDLFTFSELVGSGLPLWTPKGTLIRNLLDDFVWQLRREKGYEKVEIPHITKKDLYERSGHWDKFKDELFRITTREKHEFAMKPMNCPHHTQIFNRKPHSYREMPQRYANTTMVYRDEQSGELAGLSRVRAITQDDAHVFCRKSQAKQELLNIWDIIDTFYQAAGFSLSVRLSLSDPSHPEQYLGTRKDWQYAEDQLRQLANERGVKVVEAPGEAAFYAPKLDFMAKDSLGREWQVATNQLDVHMPTRFGLFCINESGEKEPIFMIHAAIMGSIERYLSILIEHFAGAFPLWLAPVQVAILPLSDAHENYAHTLHKTFKDAGLRAEVWAEGGSIAKRIRVAESQKIPYMLILGDKELESNTAALRVRGQEDRGSHSVKALIQLMQQKSNQKSLEL